MNINFSGRVLLFVWLLAAMTTTLHRTQAAEQLPRALPLQNPGFEEGLKDWAVAPKFQDQITVETKEVHGGKQAIKLDAIQKRNMPFVAQSIAGLTGAAVYRFSVWARTAPGAPAADAAIKMEDYNAAGKNTRGVYGSLKLPADGSWQHVVLTHQADSDTMRASLLIRVMNGSAVIFDDTEFSLVKNPPAVSIVAPTQQTFQAGEQRAVKYEVALQQPWQGAAPPVFKAMVRPLELPGDSGVAKTETPLVSAGADKRHFHVALALPMDERDYEIHLGYERDGQFVQSEAPAYVFAALPAAQRKPKNLTENGTILHQGKPFFPIGMYHVGLADYPVLAENGFNAIQGDATNDLEKFKASLDAAQKYGLAVDVPLYGGAQVIKNLQSSLEKIQRFADHPALLCWKIIDEPNLRPEISHEVPPVYRALKAADSKNPIELTISGGAALEHWGDFADIAQVDVYPLPTRPLTDVSDNARLAMNALKPWQNLSFVVQCGWTADLSNQPSPAQARSMVYLSLIEGAKGIWWYSMHDPGWDLTKSPLWPQMKAINAEIKVLAEPLMLGRVVADIKSEQPEIFFRAVEYQNKTYLLVTNPQNKSAQVTFSLPKSIRSWRPLGSDAKSSVEHQRMQVSLTGIDSRTFVLEK
jgi:hypothetical protein